MVVRETEEVVEEGEELLCERGPGERSWGAREGLGTCLRALLRGIVA